MSFLKNVSHFTQGLTRDGFTVKLIWPNALALLKPKYSLVNTPSWRLPLGGVQPEWNLPRFSTTIQGFSFEESSLSLAYKRLARSINRPPTSTHQI